MLLHWVESLRIKPGMISPAIYPGAEQQQPYVREAGLLYASRKLLLLEKVHRGEQQNFRKTGSMRREQGKVWDCHLKRKIALLLGLLPEFHKSNKKSHLPHTHTWRHLRVTAIIIFLTPALLFSKDCCSWALLFLCLANYTSHDLCHWTPENLWKYF